MYKLSVFFTIIFGLFVAQAVQAEDSAVGAKSSLVGGDYVLMPSDFLQIRVFQEEDLGREVSVSQNLTISLPLIGTVDVKGRTVRETEALIRDLYDKDFLVNPQVNLTVIRYAERTVNILGAVNSPGPVVFPQEKGLTFLEGISRAGGFNRLANKNKIKLTRTELDGEKTTYIIDADKLIDGRGDNAWSLQINDVIFVPESIF